MSDVRERLAAIEKLETEFSQRAASTVSDGQPMFISSLYAFGAVKRTLAQSRGFRSAIEARNFPCAAILLRTQIDTAMRINGLRYLEDRELQLREMLKQDKKFSQLVSVERTDKGKSIRMWDAYLREKLEEEHAWIGPVYEQTSDFVHLSFRSFLSSIRGTDDETQSVELLISGEDVRRDEADYFEICDAFFQTTKVAATLVLGLLIALGTDQSPGMTE